MGRLGLAAGGRAALLAVLSHGPFAALPDRRGVLRVTELGILVLSGMLGYAVLLQLLGVVDLRVLPARIGARLRGARLRRRRSQPTASPERGARTGKPS